MELNIDPKMGLLKIEPIKVQLIIEPKMEPVKLQFNVQPIQQPVMMQQHNDEAYGTMSNNDAM